MLCYEGLGPEIGKGVYKPCFMYKLINSINQRISISFLSHFLSVLAKFSFLFSYRDLVRAMTYHWCQPIIRCKCSVEYPIPTTPKPELKNQHVECRWWGHQRTHKCCGHVFVCTLVTFILHLLWFDQEKFSSLRPGGMDIIQL